METNFTISEKDQELIVAWQNKMNEKLVARKINPAAGAGGGRFTFSFTPTMLGFTVFKVQDDLAHETLDLTDYDF